MAAATHKIISSFVADFDALPAPADKLAEVARQAARLAVLAWGSARDAFKTASTAQRYEYTADNASVVLALESILGLADDLAIKLENSLAAFEKVETALLAYATVTSAETAEETSLFQASRIKCLLSVRVLVALIGSAAIAVTAFLMSRESDISCVNCRS